MTNTVEFKVKPDGKVPTEVEALARFRLWLLSVKFIDYRFEVQTGQGGLYLQANYVEPDIVSGKPEQQFTRRWLLSPHMTKSEFVQTCFKCCLTSMEHRTREAFTWRGRRIFGPHFDVDALHAICKDDSLDYRREKQ